MIKDLFEWLNVRAPKCPKCGKRLSVVEIKAGYGDEIIGTYACLNEECLGHKSGIRSFLRMLPRAVGEIKDAGILSEEELLYIERQRSAASAAVIRCPTCGYKREYIESVFIGEEPVLLHRFRCKNEKCADFGNTVRRAFSNEECDRIIEKHREDGRCRICGEVTGAKVKCGLRGGYICEKHCRGCEWHDERTSRVDCLWYRRKGIPDAAKKGFEAFEKEVREHEEI